MWKYMDGIKDGKTWIKHDTKIVDIREAILGDFAISTAANMKFVVGTDSQVMGKKTTYTTVIVRGNYSDNWDKKAINPFTGEKTGWWDASYGYRVYFKNTRKLTPHWHVDGSYTDKQRLIDEAYESISVAQWLNPVLESIGYDIVDGIKVPKHEVYCVHADINNKKFEFSNSVMGEVNGAIRGHGFLPAFKPIAWVAYAVADHRTRY